jgi:hypothetical protein
MYDHREGLYSVGELQFEMNHLETIATLLSSISIEFTDLVARICREITSGGGLAANIGCR